METSLEEGCIETVKGEVFRCVFSGPRVVIGRVHSGPKWCCGRGVILIRGLLEFLVGSALVWLVSI